MSTAAERPSRPEVVPLLTDLLVRGLEHLGSSLVANLPDGEYAGPPPSSHGQPVVLVGGLGTTAPVLAPMANWLTGLGYSVHPVTIGAGLDCAGRSVDALVERVRAVARDAGRPVVLVGHSRGGQFARASVERVPDDVAGLVTLGTPFDLFRLGRATMLSVVVLAAAGTVGLPDVARLSCLFGGCCRRFRSQLRGAWPADKPFVSIYSPVDAVVPAPSSIDPAADNVAVVGGHVELLTGHHARAALSDAVARCAPRAAARAS